MRKWLLLSFLALTLFLPMVSSAQTDCTQTFSLFPSEAQALCKKDYRYYIQAFYAFAIPASILVATVLIMIGGVIWLTSAGDQNRIAKARQYIINPIIGVILLMAAYLILGLINPNLVNLQPVKFEALDLPGACVEAGGCFDYTDPSKGSTALKKNCSESTQTFFPGETCHDSNALDQQKKTASQRKSCSATTQRFSAPSQDFAAKRCVNTTGGICEGCSATPTLTNLNGQLYECACQGTGQAVGSSAEEILQKQKNEACIQLSGGIIPVTLTQSGSCADYCKTGSYSSPSSNVSVTCITTNQTCVKSGTILCDQVKCDCGLQ